MKKIFIVMFSLLLLISSIECHSINAASYTVSEKFDANWELKGDMWGPGTLLYVNDEIAFCLDSMKVAYVGTNTSVSASSLGLTSNDMQKLSLIAWYGYRSKSNPTNTDYFLTQNLIWEYLGTPSNFTANSTYPTKASMRTKLDAIMSKVNNYFVKPSFNNKTYNMVYGETLELTDTNKVLSELSMKSVTGATVTKKDNTLKITPDKTASQIKITFHRGLTSSQTKTNFIVKSGTSQPVSPLYTGSDPYSASITINVTQLGNLQLAKKDPNGKLIPNTTFKLSYNKDMSNPIGTYTTKENGLVIVEGIKSGKVYIQEVSVPSYLKLDQTIIEKNITANILNYYTAVNEWNYINLQLAKKDPNGKLIADTTFKLSYNSDMSNPIGTFTTGSDGKIIVENLLIKKIYIQEIDVPDHLRLDNTIYSKTLVDVTSKINYYTAINEWKTIDLQLAKKDPNGNLVPNTTFMLSYNADMSDPLGTYTTGSDGKIIVEDLFIKTIYIQEIEVPDYLELDNQIYSKTLVDVYPNMNYYTATNKFATNSLVITKKDNAGNSVYGAIFDISYDESMQEVIGSFSTDRNGTITIDNLKVGKIYIQETSTPSHLILDDTIICIDIYKDKISYYNPINQLKTSSLIIHKKDNEGSNVENVSFELSYNEDMSDRIGIFTTQQDGTVTINNLNIQTVYIREISVPEHIQLDDTIHSIDIIEDEVVTLNITNNILTNTLIINKIDNLGNPIKDVSFILSYYPSMYETIGYYTTDDNGQIIVDNLKVGDVYIREVAVPDHIYIDKTVDTIKINKDNISYYNKMNILKTSDLIIVKKDNKDHLIKDVTFAISYDKDMSNIIGHYTTNEEGIVRIPSLKIGTVYIKEINVPDHLELDDTIHSVQIKENETSYYTFINNLKVNDIYISKKVLGNAADFDKEFHFQMILNDQSIQGEYGDLSFVNGVAYFTLKHGETKSIVHLPRYIEYTIIEDDYNDYLTYIKTSHDNQYINTNTYSAVLNDNHYIEYENHKDYIVPTSINLNISKYVVWCLLSLFFIIVLSIIK